MIGDLTLFGDFIIVVLQMFLIYAFLVACARFYRLRQTETTLHYTTKGHDEPHLGVTDVGFHLIPRCLNKLKSLDTV